MKSEKVFGARYNVFRDDRKLILAQKKSGGGVLVAVKSDYDSELIVADKFNEFEQVWVKSFIAGETHIFVSVYFPPEHSNRACYDTFFSCFEKVASNFKPEFKIHLYGDFNQRNAVFIPDNENESILLPICGVTSR